MAKAIETVVKKYRFTSLEAFNSALREYNLQAQVTSPHAADQHRGLTYMILSSEGERIGPPVASSIFYCKPTLPNLEEKFRENGRAMDGPKAHLLFRMNSVAQRTHSGIQGYFSALRNERISTVIHHSRAGEVLGFTYVDHENRCVFEEAELPQACSARKILARFGLQDALLAVDQSRERIHPQGPTLLKEPERAYESQPRGEPAAKPQKRRMLIKRSVATELLPGSPLAERFKGREKTPEAEEALEKALPRQRRGISSDL